MRRLIILSILLLCTPMVNAQQRTVPQSRGEITMSFAPLVKRTAPSVVNVYAKSIVEGLLQHGIFIRMPAMAPQNRCIRVSCGTQGNLNLLAEVLPKVLKSLPEPTAL